MEIVIIVVLAVAVIGWFLWKDRKYEESGSHPLDGATKAPEPWPFPTSRPNETTTKPDGIGHESIPVMPTLTNVLDVNKDGKVDVKDALAAADVVVEKTTKAAKKAKAKVVEAKEKAKKAVKKTTSKSKSK
jgi:flagellar basal body-associated protein FliL